MAESDSSGCGWAIAGLVLVAVCYGAKDRAPTGEVQQGDLSLSGGSPTVRREYEPQPDDPYTTDDESNDQPVGYFGTRTLSIAGENGNIYTLDGEIEGGELRRVYSPRGGWVDFPGCELESDFSGSCFDEEGRYWTIYGDSLAHTSGEVEEEEAGVSSYNEPEEDDEQDEDGDGEPDDQR
jgi:hypothetical protein